MFVEEARWLRQQLAALPLPDAARVLDIGSQSLEFRTVHQPWIEEQIHAPLRGRGATIVNLDFQDAPGIDVVADVTSAAFDAEAVGAFDLILCCNLLEHVTDRSATLRNLHGLLAPGGSLAVTVPGHFPYHEDPIDTMYRPSPQDLLTDIRFAAPDLLPVASGSVPCLGRSYYKSAKSRIRLWIPPLRWRTSCVLLRGEVRASLTAVASALLTDIGGGDGGVMVDGDVVAGNDRTT